MLVKITHYGRQGSLLVSGQISGYPWNWVVGNILYSCILLYISIQARIHNQCWVLLYINTANSSTPKKNLQYLPSMRECVYPALLVRLSFAPISFLHPYAETLSTNFELDTYELVFFNLTYTSICKGFTKLVPRA